MSFAEPLSQYVSIDVGDVINQTISVKTAQSPKPINQLKLRKLSSGLIISSSIKILKSDIPAVVMIIISQKMI